MDRLREDYGSDVADRLFFFLHGNNKNKTRSGRAAVFQPADPNDPRAAWDGIRRKIAIKLLQSALLSSPSTAASPSFSAASPTLVWATAGHSAAAGHGNFYNQSYTAVMEQRLNRFFESLPLEFVGRNYAVGGASSGPEVALCLGQLLGHDDVDIVSWDYGMTDGSYYERLELFMVKAAQLPSRPVAVAFPRELDVDEASRGRRRQVLANLARWGMPAFVQDEAKFQTALRDHIPDTYGRTQAEIERMSRYTRSFVCQGLIEEGDPYCSDDKFDMAACPDRRFRTSWHPGWKWHAYQGNLMAMFVADAVEGAVAMLRAYVADRRLDSDLKGLLEQLVDSERTAYQHVLGNVSASLPPYAYRYHRQERDHDDGDDDSSSADDGGGDDARSGGNQWLRRLYYTAPNYCHIALLPSEIRYRGILDEHPTPPVFVDRLAAVTSPADFAPALVRNPWEASLTLDDDGTAAIRNATSSSSDDEMLLLGDPDTRQTDCPIPLNVDHQDFFFVPERDGWRHVQLPNRREVDAYGNGNGGGTLRPGPGPAPVPGSQLRGVVAICYVGCPWGKCMDSDVRWQVGDENVVDLKVNGVAVTKLREMDAHSNCHVLEHEGGYVWEDPAHEPAAATGTATGRADPAPSPAVGRFLISARVTGSRTNYVRFSSFLVW